MAVRRIRADLHVHTCLSPCAGLDMSPRGVVQEAIRRGLDLVGICDHNSAENVSAAKRAGEKHGVQVLGGMEVTSSEEAHILVFFDDDRDLTRFQEVVYRHLPGENDERAFGRQVIADENDGVTGFCSKLLIGATTLTAEQIVAAARAGSGESLVIAAHVDREAFSIIGQLGFVPPSLGLDAVEISAAMTLDTARSRFPDCARYPVITGSDAHEPRDMGRRVMLFDIIEAATMGELKKALSGAGGRKAVWA